ncbi:hypothetical protein GN956_G13983 [Arapaima gigas]
MTFYRRDEQTEVRVTCQLAWYKRDNRGGDKRAGVPGAERTERPAADSTAGERELDSTRPGDAPLFFPSDKPLKASWASSMS